VGVDDAPDDLFGHSPVVPVHDREKGRSNAGGGGDGVDRTASNPGAPLGAQNRKRMRGTQDGRP
jgi:hypothetical protein